MTKITIPSELTNQLLNGLIKSRNGVQLCDTSGLTLGVFTPSPDLILEPPPLSEEELVRREKDGPFYTTQEVLAHLRSL
jgi:hypothetical protein